MRIVAPIHTKKILLVRQNSQKKLFFWRGNFTHFLSKSFQIWDYLFPLLFPNDPENLTSLDIRLYEVGAKRRLNGVKKWKKSVKKNSSPRRFYTFYEQKFSNLRPLLSFTFPQGFQKSKEFGHWISGSGDKKTVNRSEKHQ